MILVFGPGEGRSDFNSKHDLHKLKYTAPVKVELCLHVNVTCVLTNVIVTVSVTALQSLQNLSKL